MIKLYNLKSKENLYSYYSFKEKKGNFFSERYLEKFLDETESSILKFNNNLKFNTVFVPETSNRNLIILAKRLAENIIIIKKESKEKVIEGLKKQNFQKKEKEALLKSLENDKKIKIANIKGNQRKRFIDLLFIHHNFPDSYYDNSLFLDDSSFSSTTYLAATSKIKNTTKQAIIFYKD